MRLLQELFRIPQVTQIRCKQKSKPRLKETPHLICFKQWTSEMVMEILTSALNLKTKFGDTHNRQWDLLRQSKIMILQEVNRPILNMAVSKAATMLGATDVNIVDSIVWDHDYTGRVFSMMSDTIFVSTATHMCIQRFADQSTVPVICMMSRTHATIQALSTIMAIMEEFGAMSNQNIGYLGPPHPILNSYLLLCPMLGANLRFMCCSSRCPVSPLLFNASKELINETRTEMHTCQSREELLTNAQVVISGPAAKKKEDRQLFRVSVSDIQKNTQGNWIYFHTCPRGEEVDEDLFSHQNSRTYAAFGNMQFIAAALMAKAIKGHFF